MQNVLSQEELELHKTVVVQQLDLWHEDGTDLLTLRMVYEHLLILEKNTEGNDDVRTFILGTCTELLDTGTHRDKVPTLLLARFGYIRAKAMNGHSPTEETLTAFAKAVVAFEDVVRALEGFPLEGEDPEALKECVGGSVLTANLGEIREELRVARDIMDSVDPTATMKQ